MASLPAPPAKGTNPISPQHYPPPGSTPSSPTAQRNMLGTQPAVALSMFVDMDSVLPPPQTHRSQSYTGGYTTPYGTGGGSAATTPLRVGGARSPNQTPRQSLIGFDPLAPGSNPGSSHFTTTNVGQVSPSMSPRIQMAMSTSPRVASPMASPSHKHRPVQSFDDVDLMGISQIAMEQERIRQEHNQKMRAQSVDIQTNSANNNGVTPKPPTHNRKSKSPSRASRISGMFKKDKREKEKRPPGPTRHGSMIEKNKKNPATASKSLPTTPRGSGAAATDPQRLSMYPGIASDLMDLKLGNLELPNLAKPLPTSFLTGKEDEVVRTSGEAAPFQMEIPGLPETLVVARLNQFVDTYRLSDQNFDLREWVGYSQLDLRSVKNPQHIPIAEALLDCGENNIVIRGVVSKGLDEERIECVIFEGQRQFLAVFTGTHEQQAKGVAKNKKKVVPMDVAHKKVEVYEGYLEEYMKLENECFAILDKLTDEEPFCDVAFSGYSFGGAMATLGAFRYANARPTSRVICLTMASPKTGMSMFQSLVKSMPNLKVMRLELGQDGKCHLPSGGSHVGHTLVLNGSLGSKAEKVTQPVLAYNFDAPKHKKFGTKHPSLQAYVTALEEIFRLKLKWVKDFVGTSGKGVVVNNESRLVV